MENIKLPKYHKTELQKFAEAGKISAVFQATNDYPQKYRVQIRNNESGELQETSRKYYAAQIEEMFFLSHLDLLKLIA